MNTRLIKLVLLGPILAMLLLGLCFGDDRWTAPPGQPDQMWSKVDHDPKLSDPFLDSEEWSYWEGSRELPDKGMWGGEEAPPKLKHTARCFSTSRGVKHEVRFCKARLLDADKIDFFIKEFNPAFFDNLRVRIRNGMFTCQYWTQYIDGRTAYLTWTTKRQKLTLDKKAYRKGEEIKGRIDIEVLDELIDPEYPDRPPRRIVLYGVLKTTVE